MNNPSITQLPDLFGLTGSQRQAATERSQNLAVTAGAGSGKTRTLVTRYLGLLAEGLQPRQVVAITFTEKASREMRWRTRLWLREILLHSATLAERARWSALDSQMDSARIGTIHSLCAEILRNHPAEACLDPRFVVTDQNQAAALRAAAVENAMVWAAQNPVMETLFRAFSLGNLTRLLSSLLDKRLDVTSGAFDPANLMRQMTQALSNFLKDDRLVEICTELKLAQANHSLVADAGDAMAAQVIDLLSLFGRATAALAQDQPVEAAQALFKVRRTQMRLNIGKKGCRAKEAVKALRDSYDQALNDWLGGSDGKDPPPDPALEQILLEIAPLLAQLFQQALDLYRAQLNGMSGLDFDDLEAGTVRLLQNPAIRARWQQEVAAVLVDEFQDTNARQREIILGLSGDEKPGRLFVVGDARQSIYRFRGADVSVFTGLQAELKQQGGLSINLDRTYRAHPALLNCMGALLEPVMGSAPDPQRPFLIPYARLIPERSASLDRVKAPYVECILAAAEDAEAARPAAARALAQRLSELNQSGEIQSWDEVALLFRASTTFPIYEQALEDSGIPFVTVSGTGFYDRPEVRDLLNMLRALSDPWDDLALAGLLRSPAFGISDVGLYQLRCPASDRPALQARPLYEAIQGNLSSLSQLDQDHAARAFAILAELSRLVDRLPVADLLQLLLQRTDYRATLAHSGVNAHMPGSARLWRNVDKLIGDAQTSGQVRVRAFLEYIDSMRDVGAREAEAASEGASEGKGSVRLMTIHKSKGLEFPFVVLADAARRPNPGREIAFRMATAWTFAPDKLEGSPLGYRLARWQDARQAEAEDRRLLYVAMTRAKEKLIVNGHLRLKDGRVTADGWLGSLLEAGGILPASLLEQAGAWRRFSLPGDGEWAIWMAQVDSEAPSIPSIPAQPWPESDARPLFMPLAGPQPAVESRERRLISLEPRNPPARVVGEMVHKALQRWRFPGDPLLEPLLRTRAQAEGLLDDTLLQQAVRQAERLLARFQAHALYAEMNGALERYHEVPYTTTAPPRDRAAWGFIDCLYRTPAGWVLVDFKTDELRSPNALDAAVQKYGGQLRRYQQAAEKMIGASPRCLMCFLNFEREIVTREVTW
jgi:ATP-dependent helicase/nuclease subunit A